ncbi:MAG: HEAT repeat domain-containing protein [Anaerolineaceae bacterium]|nr:HEAT repeat domain-containing protein [Anaerolineaceae bacterium]
MGLFSGYRISRWVEQGDVFALRKYFIKKSSRKIETEADRQLQVKIIQALGEIGSDEAAKLLAAIAGVSDYEYRVNDQTKLCAVKTLGNLSPEVILSPLTDIVGLGNINENMFMTASEILLKNTGKNGTKVIQQAIKENRHLRPNLLLEKILEQKDSTLVSLLPLLMKSASGANKEKTIETLLQYPEEVAAEDFVPLLDEEGNSKYIEKVYQLLDKKKWKPEKQESIIKKALVQKDAKPLVRIGKKDFSVLVDLLDENEIKKIMGSSYYAVHFPYYTVMDALGKLGDSRALPPLIDLIQKNDDVSKVTAAIRALGKIGDKEAGPVLVSAYENFRNDRTEFRRDAAVYVLAENGWELDFLIEMLESQKKDYRLKCAKALVSMYKDEKIPVSVKEKIFAQRKAINSRHKDKSWKEHMDNGVRPKSRSHDCGHSDYQATNHDDKGIGVKFPLV